MAFDTVKDFSVDFVPKRKVQAVMVDGYQAEITNDDLAFFLKLLVIDPKTKDAYKFKETIVNNTKNPRSREFSEFLNDSGADWTDADDLIGLMFEAEIVGEKYLELEVPILCSRKLLRLPLSSKE